MRHTDDFVEFLACIAEENDPAVVKDIDKFINAHLSFYGEDKLGLDSERRRLAAAFAERAQDTGLKQLILTKILKPQPVG